MTESEILSNAIQAAQAATAILSLFFAIVSAYVVGLYLFLHKAPLGLRLLTFLLFTISMVALGMLAFNLQYLGEGMHRAWVNLPQKSTGLDVLGPPIIARSLFLDGRAAAFWGRMVYGGRRVPRPRLSDLHLPLAAFALPDALRITGCRHQSSCLLCRLRWSTASLRNG
jgi:hypothetical protein